RAGSRVAVVGDGPVGLLAVLLIRLSSPRELLLVGRRPERLRHGEGCGATAGVAAGAALADLAGGVDLVVEATHPPSGAASALRLARRGGSVLLLGISGAGRAAVDPDLISLGQLRVQGGFAASPAAWRWMVSLYASGQFDPAPLITHRYPLAKVAAALETLADPASGAVKVLVTP